MVRVFDLHLSKRALVLRVFYACVLAGFMLFMFLYLPFHAVGIASRFIPSDYLPEIQLFVSNFATSSSLPALGVLLAMLTFVETIIKGSWVYGVMIVVIGGFWIFFDATLYREGILFAGMVPSAVTLANGKQLLLSPSLQSEILLFITGIFVLFVIQSIFTIIKGARILWRKRCRAGTILSRTSKEEKSGYMTAERRQNARSLRVAMYSQVARKRVPEQRMLT